MYDWYNHRKDKIIIRKSEKAMTSIVDKLQEFCLAYINHIQCKLKMTSAKRNFSILIDGHHGNSSFENPNNLAPWDKRASPAHYLFVFTTTTKVYCFVCISAGTFSLCFFFRFPTWKLLITSTPKKELLITCSLLIGEIYFWSNKALVYMCLNIKFVFTRP